LKTYAKPVMEIIKYDIADIHLETGEGNSNTSNEPGEEPGDPTGSDD